MEREKTNDGFNKAINRLLVNITVRTLWIYVLATLKEGPTYPYQLKKIIREKFSFNPPTVTLYTVVYKLERDGLIEKAPDGMYKITDGGLKALSEASKLLMEIAQKISSVESPAVAERTMESSEEIRRPQ
ncbi:PadR family transcriptional regulator [Acidilobus sp.]|jgi:DNA-binding PadR family transcriptional regulator|uniref:PadR family transcriptional regulator n=1 Tax=Acidilobus sp. TaxID=1872109 RepID=UPI003D05325A